MPTAGHCKRERAGVGSPFFASRVATIAIAFAAAATPAVGPAATATEHVIVAAGPMSGGRSAMGLVVRQAAQLAVGDLNAAGRMPGGRLRLVTIDDGCEAEAAAAAARSVVDLKPALVVGHPCAAAAIAAARVYAAAGILFIGAGVRHPFLTDRRAGPTIFRLAGRDDQLGADAAGYLAARSAGGAIAVVHDRTAYARGLAGSIRSALAARGLTAAPVLPINAGEKDYGAQVALLREKRPAAVFFAGFPAEGGTMLRQMRAGGLEILFLGADVITTRELADTAGEAAEGAEALVPHDPMRRPEARKLAERLGIAVDAAGSLLPLTYLAVDIWAEAAGRTTVSDGRSVAAVLHAGEFRTFLGPIVFNDRGDASLSSYEPVRWHAGTWMALQ